MTRKSKSYLYKALAFFIVFLCFIPAVKFIDVKRIGPQESEVGLAALNGFVKNLLGFHQVWYDITEFLGIIAILVAAGFALLGLYQLIKNKSFKKVDSDLYLLCAAYVTVMFAYVVFEVIIINYRPVILEEGLEASFPSSHTMLALVIMGTAIYQFQYRIQNQSLRHAAIVISLLMIGLIVIGRVLAGVHWFTDILAGLCLGMSIVFVYAGLLEDMLGRRRKRKVRRFEFK